MKMLLLALLLVTQRVPSPAVQVGTITGRLLNEDGSPAIKVRVSAMAIPQNASEAPTLMTLAETDNTGRYRLTDVLVGRYYIVAGFVDSPTYFPRGTTAARATPVSVTANATVANIDFRIEKPSTGVTVSGRVITESNPSAGTIQVSLSGGGGTGGYTNLNVPVKLDGSFEFARVRSGTYTISVGPTPIPEQRSVVILDKDVTGLELRIPWTAEVNGRVAVEGGGPIPNFGLTFSGGNRQIQTGYYQGANQSFRATLPEGYYVTTISNMPSGYFLKSLTTRDVSLLSAPLHVARTDVPSEIMVTLGVSTPPPWVKLSGRLTGSSQGITSISLSGQQTGGNLTSSVAADGSFEFAKILPGSYNVNITPVNTVTASQPMTLVVPNIDVSGVELALPAAREISGRVVVEGGGPLPLVSLMVTQATEEQKRETSSTPPTLAQLLVTTLNRGAPVNISLPLQQDGTFKTSMPEGQYPVTVNIPTNGGGGAPPYTVKSFTFGPSDLIREPLRVTANNPAEMQLTLSSTTPGAWVKVTGRVIGLPGGSSPQTSVPTVYLNSGAFRSVTATVRPDGTFEFPRVYSGTYQAQLSGVPLPMGIARVEVTVGSADVTGVEFVIPPQKEISGRIILEGRGALPRLSLPLISTSAANGFPSQTGTITINPQPDGTFKVTVPLEERQVGRPNGLPAGYALKSVRYGSIDLAGAPLKVSATDTAELSVTLTTPDLPPVKVSGKVTGIDTAAFARGPVTLTLNEPRFLTSLQATLSRDGTFEFASVFPGTYSVAVTNVTGTNIPPIVVATRDLTGLEISVPRQKEVIGKIVLEGSGPMPRLAVPMNIVGFAPGGGTGPTLFMNINPQPDGTFRVNVQEGERRVGQITGMPQGYSVKAMTYGNVDVLSNPMKVTPGDTAELRVTVSTPNTSPVKVAGKITGLDTAILSRGPVSVSMSASGYASTFQTTVAADGSFQFAEVFPGSYSARVTGAGIAPNQATTIVVSNADVRNVEMAVTRQREISGRVVLEGPGPMPRFSFPLNSPGSALFLGNIGISPQQDGTFRFNVPEGEHRPGPIAGLPPGYAVKAMTYGTVDLLSAPMKVTPGDTTELRVTISTPTTSPVKLSGKVSGLDATMLSRGAVTVALLTPSYVRTFQTNVASDGSFEFPEVFPGNYTARVAGPGIAPHQPMAIAVSTTDVRNVEIALPGQREITGRVVVEGSAPIPRFSFRLPQAPGANGLVAQVLSIAPATNGSFRLSLPEGERPLGDVIGLPPGYTLKAATYGTVDLIHDSLKVAKTDTGELVFTVSASGLKPVSVSGKVDGLDAAVLTQGVARVIMASPAYAGNLSAAVRPDGSFEFLSVFPGSYVAQVSSPTLTAAPPPAGIPAGIPAELLPGLAVATNIVPAGGTGVPVTVTDSDIRNLSLSSPRQYPISGRVEILGGGPIPRLGLTFATQGAAGAPVTITTTTFTTQPDGTFRFTLPEGERRAGVGQIPPGYALKSITYGTIDLQQTSLKVGANQTSSELRVTLEKLQPTPWVRVSGKVIGLPAEVRNVRVALSGLFTSPQNIPLNPDGTFAFDQVFQGPNSVRLLGNIGETLQPPLNITVGPKDMTDVEIVYRR